MSYNILLFDNNTETADNIIDILNLGHYNVTHALNGKIGIDIIQNNKPDLILCDMMMPQLDRHGVFHILRSKPETAGIPFIFLTAKSEDHNFRSDMNLGANDYICKPFDAHDLLKIIDMRINNGTVKSTAERKDKVLSNNIIDEDLEELIKGRSIRFLKKKKLIYMEGQMPMVLYYIKNGKIKTYKANHDGKELITGIYSEGDFLGYIPLLKDKPLNENAEVLEDVNLLLIPKQDFLNLVYSSNNIAKLFFAMVINNLEDTENRLLDIAYQSVRQRVANMLLELHDRFGNINDPIIRIARKDLSRIVGTATESLNRTLADFKEEGIIQILSDGLKIVSKERLERLTH